MKTFLKHFFLALTLISFAASFLIDIFELKYDDSAIGGITVAVMFVFGFIRKVARELLALLRDGGVQQWRLLIEIGLSVLIAIIFDQISYRVRRYIKSQKSTS
jgi:hypothetical protein